MSGLLYGSDKFNPSAAFSENWPSARVCTAPAALPSRKCLTRTIRLVALALVGPDGCDHSRSGAARGSQEQAIAIFAESELFGVFDFSRIAINRSVILCTVISG